MLVLRHDTLEGGTSTVASPVQEGPSARAPSLKRAAPPAQQSESPAASVPSSKPLPTASNHLEWYFRQLAVWDKLTPQQERALREDIKSGGPSAEAARERLSENCLRLVVSIAQKYRNFGLAFEDLIAEGNYALARAAKDFTPQERCKFSTFAGTYIKNAILDALNTQLGVIKINACAQKLARSIRRTGNQIEQATGSRPSDEEVAAHFDISPTRLRRTLERIEQAQTVSLDAPLDQTQLSEPHPRKLVERLADPAATPDALVATAELCAELKRALERLALHPDRRLHQIVVEHAMLPNDERRSFRDFARRWGTKHNRPYEIEKKALAMLGVELGITEE